MLSLRIILLLSVVVGYWCSEVNGLAMTDLFDVRDGQDAPGSCFSYMDRLDGLVNDALSLSAAGQKAANEAYTPGTPGSRIVNSFFRTAQPNLGIIVSMYAGVVNFLSLGPGQVSTDDGYSNTQPILFCNDDWRVFQDSGSPARDGDGNIMLNADETVMTVQQYKGAEQQQKYQETGVLYYPYWSSVFNEYFWDLDPSEAGCERGDGFTNLREPPLGTIVTLCPDSFDDGSALADTTISPVSEARYYNLYTQGGDLSGLQSLVDVLPTAGTFLHELFHMMWGDDLTQPAGGEEIDLDICLGLMPGQAILNPETYVFVAVGYYFTGQSTPPTVVEFFSGYATYL